MSLRVHLISSAPVVMKKGLTKPSLWFLMECMALFSKTRSTSGNSSLALMRPGLKKNLRFYLHIDGFGGDGRGCRILGGDGLWE